MNVSFILQQQQQKAENLIPHTTKDKAKNLIQKATILASSTRHLVLTRKSWSATMKEIFLMMVSSKQALSIWCTSNDSDKGTDSCNHSQKGKALCFIRKYDCIFE